MTQAEVQATLLSANYTMANLINANLLQMQKGNGLVSWATIRQYNRNIAGLAYCFEGGDYTSTQCTTLYNCLNGLIGINTSTATIDPNFVNPGIIIDVNNPFAPLLLVRNQGNLIDADPPNGNWYLPFLYDNSSPIVNGGVPVSVIVNGVSLSGWTFDETTVPGRIYGFPNNDAQTILVTVLNGSAGPTPPPPATEVIYWSWFASDPYATIDTDTFLFSGNIAVNPSSYTLNFGSSASGNWLAVKELATNTVKSTWFNTVLNNGTIPDSVMLAPVVIGLYRFYVSRIQVSLPTGQTSITYTV